MQLDDLLVHGIVSQLTLATLHVNVPPGSITDKTAAETLVSQVQADWHAWLLGVAGQGSQWPKAKVDFSALTGGIQTLLTGTGPLAQIVQSLLKAIPLPPAAPGNPPSPATPASTGT